MSQHLALIHVFLARLPPTSYRVALSPEEVGWRKHAVSGRTSAHDPGFFSATIETCGSRFESRLLETVFRALYNAC